MKPALTLPPTPRSVGIETGSAVGRVFLWLLLLAAWVGLPYAAHVQLTRLHTLQNTGKAVQADLVDSGVSHGKSDTYWMVVGFQMAGRHYSSKFSVTRQFYYQYASGPKVPVTTMPNDPGNYEIGPVDSEKIDSTTVAWELWASILCASSFAAVLMFELSLRFEKTLLASGEETTATVVRTNVVKGRSMITYVIYQYETPNGVREGKVSFNGDLSQTYPTGLALPILYLEKNDQKSLPLVSLNMVNLSGM